jgi:hypothetical protein
MNFSISTLAREFFGPPPRLICARRLWSAGTTELHHRTRTRHESGAFLLGKQTAAGQHIEQFLYYDDVDPNCFRNGIVEFDGRHFGKVWQHCRDLKLTVVADVHVHPGGYSQSSSDRANPMIAERGHIALILPFFARGEPKPGKMGMYEYLGSGKWQDHSAAGTKFLRIGWW